MSDPDIQHWIVPIVRAAGVKGTDTLSIPSDAEVGEAWRLAAMAAGMDTGELTPVVASHFGLPVADLDEADPHLHRLLPARVAWKLSVLPLRHTLTGLHVATADPTSLDAEREISHISGRAVHFEVADPSAIEDTLPRVYVEKPLERHQLPRLLPEEVGPHILVVDDEPDMRLLLGSVLQGAGFRVSVVESGSKALEKLRDRDDPVHLVTLDLQMEGMSGLDVLERIRGDGRTESLPVVVATADADRRTEVLLFQAGADDYVVKPVDPIRFILRLRAVLRRYGISTGAS